MAEQVRSTVYMASAVLAVIATGCSSNPLDGTWVTASTVAGFTTTTTIDVNGNGTLSTKVSGASANCSGTWSTTGFSWAATSSSITFSGTPDCTGAITCGNLSLGCSGNQSLTAGSCTYTFSNNDDTLALTACSGTSDATYTRQ